LYSIIYVSTATIPLAPDQLQTLAGEAAEKNEPRGITGLLAYNGFNFMQLLEGDEDAVEERLDRIKDDPRHSGVVVVRRETVEGRECGAWSMAARTTPLAGLGPADVLRDALPDSLREETRRLFSSFASLVR